MRTTILIAFVLISIAGVFGEKLKVPPKDVPPKEELENHFAHKPDATGHITGESNPKFTKEKKDDSHIPEIHHPPVPHKSTF